MMIQECAKSTSNVAAVERNYGNQGMSRIVYGQGRVVRYYLYLLRNDARAGALKKESEIARAELSWLCLVWCLGT